MITKEQEKLIGKRQKKLIILFVPYDPLRSLYNNGRETV